MDLGQGSPSSSSAETQRSERKDIMPAAVLDKESRASFRTKLIGTAEEQTTPVIRSDTSER